MICLMEISLTRASCLKPDVETADSHNIILINKLLTKISGDLCTLMPIQLSE